VDAAVIRKIARRTRKLVATEKISEKALGNAGTIVAEVIVK
jgi:hypothetical protein